MDNSLGRSISLGGNPTIYFCWLLLVKLFSLQALFVRYLTSEEGPTIRVEGRGTKVEQEVFPSRGEGAGS